MGEEKMDSLFKQIAFLKSQLSPSVLATFERANSPQVQSMIEIGRTLPNMSLPLMQASQAQSAMNASHALSRMNLPLMQDLQRIASRSAELYSALAPSIANVNSGDIARQIEASSQALSASAESLRRYFSGDNGLSVLLALDANRASDNTRPLRVRGVRGDSPARKDHGEHETDEDLAIREMGEIVDYAIDFGASVLRGRSLREFIEDDIVGIYPLDEAEREAEISQMEKRLLEIEASISALASRADREYVQASSNIQIRGTDEYSVFIFILLVSMAIFPSQTPQNFLEIAKFLIGIYLPDIARKIVYRLS